MKKFIVSLTLLGLFSVGSMAFIGPDNDEPPTRQTEQRRGHCGRYDGCGDHHRNHNRGGCCGDCRRDESRRDDVCCGGGYGCGACRHGSCTVDSCHERGKLCPECAEWCAGQKKDDVCKRK